MHQRKDLEGVLVIVAQEDKIPSTCNYASEEWPRKCHCGCKASKIRHTMPPKDADGSIIRIRYRVCLKEDCRRVFTTREVLG